MAKKIPLLDQLKADYKTADDHWSENRKAAAEAIKFRVPGGQWDARIKRERESIGLPCIESDKINQYIRQVVNDGRQNRPSVKVSPEEGGDIEVAEAFGGLIRSICDRSNADEAFDTGLDHAAGSGFGWLRVLTKPVREKSFLQDIDIRRVGNPLSVMLAPHSLADGSDARFGFVLDEIPKDDYKKRYPKAKETNWQDAAYTEGWVSDKNVRIVEYYYKVETTVTMHLLETGEEVEDKEYQAAIAEGIQVPVIAVDAYGKPQTRDFTVERVKWCRASGAEILEENDWLGKYIPIIPVYGNEINVEGKIVLYGLVKPAMDPQRLYNFSRSAFAQRVGMTPKAPWLMAEGQAEGYEEEWKTANSGQHQVLFYKAIDNNGTPVPPPQRISASDVPAGFQADMEIAAHDIQASMGMYSASIGERSNEKSGKAIMARQREGDTATFHYQDNLNRAIRYLGRQLVDLIPKVIDSKRAARILGEDGVAKIVDIDPEQQAPVQKIKTAQGVKVIYNLNAGVYDVSISAGPSYTTKRQEQAEASLEMVRANPNMWVTHGDLIAKTQDWPGADEWAKRSKLTMPPELKQAIEAEEDGVEPEVAAAQAQVKQVMEQARAAIEEREAALAQAQQENEALKQQLANKAGEVQVKQDEAGVKMYEARTERMQALAPAITPESIAQIVMQTVQEIMRQPVPPPPEPEIMPAMPDPNQPPDGGFLLPEGA
jgi:hypothetical protein